MEINTIIENTTAEFIEKKSKFIANIIKINSKKEAEEKIKQIKKEHYNAKHNCFAFSVVEEDNIYQKCSDDGEPQGTAGEPILNMIKKNNLTNVLIVVTRYFGGILLGTGGLVRAYSNAVNLAIEKTNIITKEKGYVVELEIEYHQIKNFKFYCEKNNIKITKIEYKENILIQIEINEEQYNTLFKENKYKNAEIYFKIEIYNIICRKFIEKIK